MPVCGRRGVVSRLCAARVFRRVAYQARGEDGEDDGAGDLARGVLHLLAHGGDHAVAGQGVGGLQEADEPGPARWPTGRG